MTHDPMCHLSKDWCWNTKHYLTNPNHHDGQCDRCTCDCDLIRRVREDERKGRNRLWNDGYSSGLRQGYERGVGNAAQAVMAHCIGDTDVDQWYWWLADDIRGLVKQ